MRFHSTICTRLPAVVLLAASLPTLLLAGNEVRFDFDSGKPGWQVLPGEPGARLRHHARQSEVKHSGGGSEYLEFESAAAVSRVRLLHALPAARLIDELTVSVWVLASQEGARLSVRVVFPQERHAVTGQPVTVQLQGGVYTDVNRWQQLTCRDLNTALRRALLPLRKRLHDETGEWPAMRTEGMYVDAVVLDCPLGKGRTRMALDELRAGPVVGAGAAPAIQVASDERAAPRGAAEFRVDQLLVDDQRFFPRIVPYHAEPVNELASLRFNVAWVPDYRDQQLLEELERAGVRAMAMPPRPELPDPDATAGGFAQLAPFGPETSRILFWYLGTRLAPQARRQVALWDEQIQNADRAFRRPVAGDVAGDERAYSRQLAMVSSSRPALHNSFGLKAYRDYLAERKGLAQPGSFFWTWVQTEPVARLEEQRARAGLEAIVVEPEQIRLQVYAALAAGCRGLGFWTTRPLRDDRPGDLERRLALALVNMELELLEPWLATATSPGQATFTARLPAPRKIVPSIVPNDRTRADQRAQREALLNDSEAQARQREQLARELEAAVMRTEFGALVLPIWYDEEAQFVPSQMAANDARIVVPGVGETARAWEVSTTSIQSLETTLVAGGRQLTLRKFDTTAAILFTSDGAVVEKLRRRVAALCEPSAQASVALARAKLERVNAVALRLQAVRPQVDAPQLLARARDFVQRAEAYLGNGRWHDARLASQDGLQMLRILQHAYWTDAVRRMYAPVSSPHALCFQTLPDHWDLIARFGRARESGTKNLLVSGDFEDFDTIVAERWRHEQSAVEGVRALAELHPRSHHGKYCLRLIAVPAAGTDPPPVIDARPVTVTTPPVTVYRGQIVYISGWVKLAAPALGNLDGVMLYDSIGGPALALRWRSPSEWHQFELVREVHETGELTLTMALAGLGEARFDDLRIVPLDPEGQPPRAETVPGKPAGSGPLDFLKRLPGFKPKTQPE